METRETSPTDGIPPTPEEARAALQAAEQARATLAEVRTPLWYFVALGLLIAPVGPAASRVPDPPAGVLLLLGGTALWVAALVTIMHLAVRQMGVLVWLDGRQVQLFALVMAPLLVAFAVVQASARPPWGSEALTVVMGVGIGLFGLVHRAQSPAPPR